MKSPIARALRAATLAAALLGAGPAPALTFVIGNGFPQVYLRIGATGATLSTVTFPVTAANAGTGVLDGIVPGSGGAASAETTNFPACPANHVRIVARARWFLSNWLTATLSVDSSAALTAGANSIPFTKITWTSDDASDLPAGGFTGGAAQVLDTFRNSREVGACHRFQFLNDTIYPPGTYVGSVTYTLSMP